MNKKVIFTVLSLALVSNSDLFSAALLARTGNRLPKAGQLALLNQLALKRAQVAPVRPFSSQINNPLFQQPAKEESWVERRHRVNLKEIEYTFGTLFRMQQIEKNPSEIEDYIKYLREDKEKYDAFVEWYAQLREQFFPKFEAVAKHLNEQQRDQYAQQLDPYSFIRFCLWRRSKTIWKNFRKDFAISAGVSFVAVSGAIFADHYGLFDDYYSLFARKRG